MTFCKSFAAFSALTLGISMAGLAAASESSPFIGTWVMNVAKSKANEGMKPKSDTLKTEAAGGGKFKTTEDIVAANGMVIHSEVIYALDGKANPELVVPEPPPSVGVETVAVKGIDARTHRVAIRNGGKLTITLMVVVSKDNKTLTTTGVGKTPDGGQPINDIRVFERR